MLSVLLVILFPASMVIAGAIVVTVVLAMIGAVVVAGRGTVVVVGVVALGCGVVKLCAGLILYLDVGILLGLGVAGLGPSGSGEKEHADRY